MQSCILPALEPGSHPLGDALLTPVMHRALGCAAQMLRVWGLQGQWGFNRVVILQAGGCWKDEGLRWGEGTRRASQARGKASTSIASKQER